MGRGFAFCRLLLGVARPMKRSRTSIALIVLATAAFVAGAAPGAPFDLSPDPSWQTNGRVRTIVYSGNTVYLGGDFTQVLPPASVGGAPVARNHVAAFDATTGDLLPWDPETDAPVWSLDVSGSTVYLGGKFTSVAGQPRGHAAAVDANTAAVLPWDPEPISTVNIVKIGPDGNVYLGGAFTRVGGKVHNALAQVTPAGITTTWRPSVKQVSGSTCPPRCLPFVASLAFSADGTALYFAGHFGLVNGIGRNNAAEVSVATAETLPWNPDVFGTGAGKNPNQANKVWHVELGRDRAYICGDYWALDGFQRHANLAAVDLTDGHLIRSFDATTDGNTPTCALRNGLLYIGGHYQNEGLNSSWVFYAGQKATLTGPGSQVRNHLAAVDAVTGAIDAWNPSTDSILGVHALTATPMQLGVGGDFTRIGGEDQQGFARFSLDTVAPDTSLTDQPPALSNSSAASFAFRSTEKSSTFRCALDGSAFAGCTSPASYSGLADGPHSFQVAAVDQAGNVDASPASASWTVDTAAPSPPTNLSGSVVSPSRASLAWTASPQPDVAAYRVYRNGNSIGETPQTSFADTSLRGPATYSYTVRAVDQAGNVSQDTGALQLVAPQSLPPFFRDDFETGDLSQWSSSSGIVVQTQEVHQGVYAARATTGGTTAYASKQLPSTVSELYYDVRFEVLSQSTAATLLRFETATGVPLVSVYVGLISHIGYRNERTVTNVNGATAVTPGWHELEARVLVNGASSEVEIWLDGIRLNDLANAESLGTAPIGRIVLGTDAAGKTFDAAFDEVATGQSRVG